MIRNVNIDVLYGIRFLYYNNYNRQLTDVNALIERKRRNINAF